MTRRRKPQTGAGEISEEVVEGIWAENQYKIENIEGYAAAFERATDLMRKATWDHEPSEQEKQDIDRAMENLVLLEMKYRWKA